MSSRTLYEQVLAMGLEAPRPRLRSSAGVVLWRRRADEIETYWVKRSNDLAFMGGFFAFPGGGLARSDQNLPIQGTAAGIDESPHEAGMPETVLAGVELDPIDVPGLLACSLRELFEETGLLLTEDVEGLDPATVEALRLRLLDPLDDLTFEGTLQALDVALDASSLIYAGRWLTPPLGPVRFDNRFFLLEWPSAQAIQPTVLEGELTHGEWTRPGEAIEHWRSSRVVTAPPILHILAVLAEEGLPGGLDRLRNPAEANVGPFRRIEFRPGVLMFPLPTPTLPPSAYTNAYLLGHGEMVLVDPGSPNAEATRGLMEAIHQLEAEGRRLVGIWLTHHHPDHVGGVERVRREFDVPVAAHELTADHLASRGLAVDRKLADGEVVELSGDPTSSVEVFHTPGHASGHLAFYLRETGSLVAGDLTAGFGTIVIDPPDGDMDDYLSSLARMRDLGATTLFPAHGPPTTQASTKFAEYLEHRFWREEKILTAWESGSQDRGELLTTAYDDVATEVRPLAARQLEAHLIRLRRAGRL